MIQQLKRRYSSNLLYLQSREEIMNILIADSIKLNQVYIDDILKNTKFSQPLDFYYADNQEEAKKTIMKYRVDLLLIDFSDGPIKAFDIVELAKNVNPNMYIIFSSFYSDHNSIIKSMRHGVNDYLIKPLNPNQVVESFNNALDTMASVEGSNKYDSYKEEKVDFVDESLNYIKENYTREIDLDSVANAVFVNPQYFSKVFKKTLGISFSEYVNRLRINHACNLLITTDWPINNISIEAGFNNVSYFNRVFKQLMNITPYRYREEKLSNRVTKDNIHKLRSM